MTNFTPIVLRCMKSLDGFLTVGIHLHSHIPLPRSYQIAAQYPMNTLS